MTDERLVHDVLWHPAYLDEGTGRGEHGMTIVFRCSGVWGATCARFYTDLLPVNSATLFKDRQGGSAARIEEVSYHSRVALLNNPCFWGGTNYSTEQCQYLDDQRCVASGSDCTGLDAHYNRFLLKGPQVLYKLLEERYREVFATSNIQHLMDYQ